MYMYMFLSPVGVLKHARLARLVAVLGPFDYAYFSNKQKTVATEQERIDTWHRNDGWGNRTSDR